MKNGLVVSGIKLSKVIRLAIWNLNLIFVSVSVLGFPFFFLLPYFLVPKYEGRPRFFLFSRPPVLFCLVRYDYDLRFTITVIIYGYMYFENG